MNRMQSWVAAFNRMVGTKRPSPPAMRGAELRARLILEEAFETVEAMLGCDQAVRTIDEVLGKWTEKIPTNDYPDFVDTIDGLCDLLYVTLGSFDAFGLDAEPFFLAVHDANMTKGGGPKDEHGKALKPDGFRSPQERIRVILDAMTGASR